MGPPKRPPKQIISIDEYRRRIDTFEYRYDSDKVEYYLYNPYTGETIFNVSDTTIVDRAVSLWYESEPFPDRNAETVVCLAVPYASRMWGRRVFRPWTSKEAAGAPTAKSSSPSPLKSSTVIE